jgi:hypothetical protein
MSVWYAKPLKNAFGMCDSSSIDPHCVEILFSFQTLNCETDNVFWRNFSSLKCFCDFVIWTHRLYHLCLLYLWIFIQYFLLYEPSRQIGCRNMLTLNSQTCFLSTLWFLYNITILIPLTYKIFWHSYIIYELISLAVLMKLKQFFLILGNIFIFLQLIWMWW